MKRKLPTPAMVLGLMSPDARRTLREVVLLAKSLRRRTAPGGPESGSHPEPARVDRETTPASPRGTRG